jgi:hypothetical protein
VLIDAPTISAIGTLIAIIGNIFLTWDARRRGINTENAMTTIIVPKLDSLHKLTNDLADQKEKQ